jgi:hypothetical protein
MKNKKNRQIRKQRRAEKQRAKRQKRLNEKREAQARVQIAPRRPREAWATAPLALRVSGRLAVVLTHAPQGAIVFIHGSLLAGGYQGSLSAIPQDKNEHDTDPMDDPARFGEHLRRVSLAEASLLAWGMFLFSAVRGTIDPEDFDGPAFGLLAPPKGKLMRCEARFLERIDPAVVELAEGVVSEGDWSADEPPAERPELEVPLGIHCTVATPLSFTYELDRLPLEFRRRPERRGYAWLPTAKDDPFGERMPSGSLQVEGDSVFAVADDARRAAALMARLEELCPEGLSVSEVIPLPLPEDEGLVIPTAPRIGTGYHPLVHSK